MPQKRIIIRGGTVIDVEAGTAATRGVAATVRG